MATISTTKALTNFFNVGEGKRRTADWSAELKALSAEEKRELALLVCAAQGDTLSEA